MEPTSVFNDRWRSQFPETPPPDLLTELKLERNVEHCSSTDLLITIKRALQDSERKIRILRDQLEKELFIKDSLDKCVREISKNNDTDIIDPKPSVTHDRSLRRTVSDTGFEQFTADLSSVNESNSVLTKHRNSLKHVERKTKELCNCDFCNVLVTGSQSGGDNYTKPKHLTKVNSFSDNKSIFKMASDSNKENSHDTDTSKMCRQVVVMQSTSQPNLLQLSSNNGSIAILDSDRHKDCTHLPSRPGPAVPKKPPKPLPHPRIKVATTSLTGKSTNSDIISLNCQTFPQNSKSSAQVTYPQVSFEVVEANRGDSCDAATCANIQSGCGLDSTTQNNKHRENTQFHSLSNNTHSCDTSTETLVKGVINSVETNLNSVNSFQVSESRTSLPTKPEPSMKMFHRHKSDRKTPSLCDEATFTTAQGTYRKISDQFESCDVISGEFQELDKPHISTDPVLPSRMSDSILPSNEDCVDCPDTSVLVFRHSTELVTHHDKTLSNTSSSLLDNVLFFKESEGELEEGVKNGDVCNVDEQDEVPLRRNKQDGEVKFLDEDCVDGKTESFNAASEELFMKKLQRLPSYENWTIDRCVTLQQLDDSNESETSEDIYCNINFQDSPPSTLHKYHSYKGSKDSGLCDDLSTSDSHPVVDGVSVNTADMPDFPPPPPEMTIIENFNDSTSTDSDESESNKHSDSGSVASDIVFIPSSELHKLHPELCHNVSIESHEDHDSLERHRRLSPLPLHRLQASPVPSSGDEDVVSSESCDEIDGVVLPESPQEKMLKLRQVLVAGVLDSEESYLEDLELLLTYKRSLLASSRSSQPVIHQEDIEAIFSNIGELHKVHVEFIASLKPIVANSPLEQNIGETFKMLILKLPVYGKYMENYQKAVSRIHRCNEEDQRFHEIAQAIKLPSNNKEVTNLEDALFKPVQRLQRNTLVLHDLIKYTPENHPDHGILKKTLSLSQHNLENLGTGIISSGALPEEKRYLVKSSFLVELIGGSRKLRYMFLFNDILVCTKKETSRRSSSFVCKWFTPLCSITRDTTFDYGDDQKYSWREEIEDMKRKIGNLKSDLRVEMKKEDSREKHWSIGGMAAARNVARNVEKLKKKIQELEASLILASPKLPVKLSHEKGKFHTLLMTTDYEREEWMEAMTLLCKKCANNNPPSLSAYDVQELINSVKEDIHFKTDNDLKYKNFQPQVNKLGSVLMQNDEDIFNGTLNVTIHKLNGLNRKCDTYCCLEMDSYDHFFMKARSHICKASSDPSWDEDFELELDGSQTLRVLVYEQRKDQSDELLGRGAMELNKSWLNMMFQERTVVMNEVSLVISVRHTPANKTMRRIPSQQKTAVFGVKISTCTKREGKTVPTIVTTCLQEIEKRGLDEVGIYRVSGVTSEVQKLKKMFDKNVRAACHLVGDSDIHAVTGVLKLYFRELPEPLFTEASYTNFIVALKLADSETRERLMISLLHGLPPANYYTIVTLVEHLVRVTKCVRDNKMGTQNLSTVFGPTLLAPAVKETQLDPMEIFSKGAEAVLHESAVVGFFLDLASSGKSLRKSAQC